MTAPPKKPSSSTRPTKMVVHSLPEPRPYTSEGWCDIPEADKPKPNYWGAFWIACACAAGLLGLYVAMVAR